jgi:hypothetical protein
MSYRDTGRILLRKENESELICDVCGKVMLEEQYPQIELEVIYCQYRYDGDQERKDICSYKCLEALAKERQAKISS